MVVGSGRARDLPAIVDRLVQRAASSKQREVATVRSAVALTDDQKERLAAALSNATGKQVDMKVVVDPSVLGGIVEHVAALAERCELVKRTVARIMVKVRTGQDHRCPPALYQNVFRRPSHAPAPAIAPALPVPIPPPSVA